MVKFSTQIRQLIDNKDWKFLKYGLNEMDPIQAAGIIEETPEDNDIILFRLLGRQLAKETFHLLSHEKQEQIIEGLAKNVRKLSELLNDIEPDDRTAFFEELPGKVSQRLIQLLSPEERDITIQLLGYPEDSIGRLMTPEYVVVKANDTVEHAFEHIRMYGKDSETLNVIYIVDKQWKLIDDIRIKELILASPEQKVSELMDSRFVALHVMDDQETAVKTFQDYDRVALPVVNNEGILLGIVTIDDIMDVVEEETTEDFHKFGSFQQSISNPLKERALQLYKNRIVWLFALVFVNIFSGAAISSFESIIQSVVSLVFFLPLLIDSGGNAGSQSATLMIRALATGDVKLSDWYKLIGKELIVSFMLGVTMAAGVAVIASFRAPEIIAVVAISMVLIVISGSLIGMLLPFIFTKFKLDPATASAPLITSISDIFGVLIYFSIAARFLG
ncbi:MAG: Magnesium transporter MgtE [Bacteroidetes bacterium ADurb.Bin037]|nr:MAG: Magnesium transporter MgtE [Bacteroidetes bacterium ADurb.Bin037]HPW78299.1 magnesium transporter [Bacteroidales bacterium]HQB56098.1 magnesium transporter [Bacteroidales bacterium]